MMRKGANIMTLYPYALFFHIVGVLGLFIPRKAP